MHIHIHLVCLTYQSFRSGSSRKTVGEEGSQKLVTFRSRYSNKAVTELATKWYISDTSVVSSREQPFLEGVDLFFWSSSCNCPFWSETPVTKNPGGTHTIRYSTLLKFVASKIWRAVHVSRAAQYYDIYRYRDFILYQYDYCNASYSSALQLVATNWRSTGHKVPISW